MPSAYQARIDMYTHIFISVNKKAAEAALVNVDPSVSPSVVNVATMD